MNQHLQLFRFFSENEQTVYLEKNLTRAFALCLKYDSALLYSFLKSWLTEDDFNSLLLNPPEDAEIAIDIEVETHGLVDNTQKLYAIGITENDSDGDWNDNLEEVEPIDKLNYTDIVITAKDITIIIEVKKTQEDCKFQLQQQMLPFIRKNNTQKCFHRSWLGIIGNLRQLHHYNILSKKENPFTFSFLQLIETRFNHWIRTTAFKYLSFDSEHKTGVYRQEVDKRLEQALRSLGDDKTMFLWDRKSIRIKQSWASEAIPEFNVKSEIPYLELNIWPGNTKGQGYSIYNRSLDWINAKDIVVGEHTFPIKISRHIKFMHFNKYITDINLSFDNPEWLKKEINTPENFYHKSGKWNRENWNELDAFLNEHFDFDWKEECGWDEHFLNTDRTYLTMSLGFRIETKIPYAYLRQIDDRDDGYKVVGELLIQVTDSIVNLVGKG